MRSFRTYITEVAKFTAKNFPGNIPGNERFSGAGERTTYTPTSKSNTFKWKGGFPLEKDTYLFDSEGKRVKKVDKGTSVHFTYPAKLYRADELNLPGRGVYAAVSLKDHTANPDGYLPISSVIKPASASQGRVGSGAATQNLIAQKVEEIAFKKSKNYEFVSTAKIGSTVPDLVVKIDGQKVQFEIKGTSSTTAPVTFFDKSVSRKRGSPKLIDEIVKTFIKHYNLDIPRNKRNTIGAIDYYKEKDSSIGLAGDTGTPKSGKLPKEFTTQDPSLMSKMRKVILEHLAEGGDNYFVIHNRSNDDLKIYYTGHGKNLLDQPPVPKFKSFSLATYGGASSGSTRVGLKIKL